MRRYRADTRRTTAGGTSAVEIASATTLVYIARREIGAIASLTPPTSDALAVRSILREASLGVNFAEISAHQLAEKDLPGATATWAHVTPLITDANARLAALGMTTCAA
jgi:hypothetical protein